MKPFKIVRSGGTIRLRYSVHAPHNITVAGKQFRGGEFIPNSFVRAATPQQRAMLGVSNPKSVGAVAFPQAHQAKPPDTPKGQAVAFVSPETGSGLTGEQAYRKMKSSLHVGWAKTYEDVDHRCGLRGEVRPAIGDWAPHGEDPGSEPTTVTVYHNPKDFDQIKYAACVKGDMSKQLAVLAFHADSKGKDALWSADLELDLDGVKELLSKIGIPFRTIEPTGHGKCRAWMFDEGGSLKNTMRALHRSHGAKIQVRWGKGEFIGGRNRADASRTYRKFIDEYERKYPDRPHYRRRQAG